MSSVPGCVIQPHTRPLRAGGGGGGPESSLPRLKARVSPATGGRGRLGRLAEPPPRVRNPTGRILPEGPGEVVGKGGGRVVPSTAVPHASANSCTRGALFVLVCNA